MTTKDKLRCALRGAVAAVILTLSTSASATMIGLNFQSSSVTDDTLMPSEMAGVVAQGNWNNLPSTMRGHAVGPGGLAATTTVNNLVDHTGSLVSGLFVSWTNVNNDFIGSNSPGTTPDSKLFRAMVEGPTGLGSPGPSITVSGLNFSSYDVYVYMAEFVSSPASVRIGSTEYFYRATSNFAATGYVQATSTTPSTATATYALFSGLTGPSFAVDGFRQGANRAAFVGLQVVATAAVDEPATLALLTLGLIVVRARSKRRTGPQV